MTVKIHSVPMQTVPDYTALVALAEKRDPPSALVELSLNVNSARVRLSALGYTVVKEVRDGAQIAWRVQPIRKHKKKP